MKKIIFLISIIALQHPLYAMKRKRKDKEEKKTGTLKEIKLLANAFQRIPRPQLLPHKILVYGAKGVGKSTHINKLIDLSQASGHSFSAADAHIEAKETNGSLNICKLIAYIKAQCTMAASKTTVLAKNTSVVHIDYIDLLFTPVEVAKTIGPVLNNCIQLAKSQRGIHMCIIGEFNDMPSLWFKREFNKTIWITLPNEEERKVLLQSLIKKYNIAIDSNVKISILATKTKGFTPYELGTIISEVLLRADGKATHKDFMESIEQIFSHQHEQAEEREQQLRESGSPSYFM